MPTRQVRDESSPTTSEGTTVPGDPTAAGGPTAPEDAAPASREPVLIGDILFETLAELARRTTPGHPLRLPAQRPHP